MSKHKVGSTYAYSEPMAVSVRGAALAMSAASVLFLFPEAAHAQGSDTLPTLDEAPIVVPEPAVEAPPPATVVVQTPAQKAKRSALGPIRARRRLALLGEVGWNGIAGFGPILVYHFTPHFSTDLGAGLSLLGWKVGVRGRYNFLTGPVTPFVGVGFMSGSGFGDSPIPINENDPDPTRETVNIKIKHSAWLQTVAGVDWIAPSGFNLLGTAGWAQLLSPDPVEVVTGTPTADEQRAFDAFFRSNIVLTIALGYSFR